MILPVIKPIFRIAALIISIVIWGLTIFSAYGGRFNPDFFTLPAVMVLLLPYFATASLLITIAWLATRHWLIAALGVLAILASWSPISSAAPLSSSKNPTPGAKSFTVMTYNLIHGRDQQHPDNQKGNPAFEYIINSDADIVCVQELISVNNSEIPNFTPSLQDSLHKAYPYQAGDPSLDMKVFSKYPIIYEKGYSYINGNFDPRRYTFYKVKIDDRTLTLINVHLMSYVLSDQERQVISGFKSLSGARQSVGELKGSIYSKLDFAFKKRKEDARILRETIDHMKGPMVICGDFNDVPESYAWRLLKGDDLKDAYAETGFGPMITYNAHAFWFHLDQILYRGPLRALWVKKGTLKASDHYPLTAEFEFTD